MANDDEGPSAADYDPTMEEDRPDHKPFVNTAQDNTNTKQSEPVEKASNPTKEFDMFAEDEDDDDMFAPTGPDSKNIEHAEIRALDSSLLDNWDYPDGHYRIIIGELLDGRYAVQQQIGKVPLLLSSKPTTQRPTRTLPSRSPATTRQCTKLAQKRWICSRC